jgi:uncharacterized protein (TIGR03086 family)
MTVAGANVAARSSGLLERAVEYLHGSLALVSVDDLARPTPCADWDLGALLAHLDDSLAALCEVGDAGFVGLRGAAPYLVAVHGVVDRLSGRADDAVLAWSEGGPAFDPALVGGCPLSAELIAGAGALEVAVHGWDVATACGVDRPIPEDLAEDLLVRLSHLVVAEDRPARFGPSLVVNPWMPAGDRLLALSGRCPAGVSRRVGLRLVRPPVG